MKNFSDKTCRENQNTHFMLNNIPHPLPKKSCLLWVNAEKYGRDRQATYYNRSHAHCMLEPKVTNTHSEYVILIALPLQESASMLRYTYIGCLVVCMCLVPSTDCYFSQVHNICALPKLWSNWDLTEPLAFICPNAKKCK